MKRLLTDSLIDPVIALCIVLRSAYRNMSNKKEGERFENKDGAIVVMVFLWLFMSIVIVGGVFYLKSNFEISEELKGKVDVYTYENY